MAMQSMLIDHSNAFFNIMPILAFLLVCRYLFGSDRRAFIPAVLLTSVYLGVWSREPQWNAMFIVYVCLASLYVFVLIGILFRAGLVAALICQNCINVILHFPITSDSSSWYFDTGLFAMTFIVAVAIGGVYLVLQSTAPHQRALS